MEKQELYNEIKDFDVLPAYVVKQLGRFDNGSRFYLRDEFKTESSRGIRTPSRAWPFSVYKHCFTKKYCAQLKQLLNEGN